MLESEVLGVLERHVEERPLGGSQLPVASGVDDRHGGGKRSSVVCEGRSLATFEVARKLIQEYDEGKRAARHLGPVELAACGGGPGVAEPAPDLGVNGGVDGEPQRLLGFDGGGIRRISAEPEIEDGVPVAARRAHRIARLD